MKELHEKREKLMMEHEKKQQTAFINEAENKMRDMSIMIQELTLENRLLKDKNQYLDAKITKLIQDLIELKKNK